MNAFDKACIGWSMAVTSTVTRRCIDCLQTTRNLSDWGSLLFPPIVMTVAYLSCLSERQNDMLNALMRDKYAPPMQEVLADDDSEEQKAVVDLGSGTGAWCVQILYLLRKYLSDVFFVMKDYRRRSRLSSL
jgi:hypothetical protein